MEGGEFPYLSLLDAWGQGFLEIGVYSLNANPISISSVDT